MMMTEQLKTFSDKVKPGLKTTQEYAKQGVERGVETAKHGWNRVYTVAMNNPKATAAVVLGTGVAAALLWLASRNGTFSALHKKVMARVKSAPARRTRRSTTRSRAATS
jgi:hypothetical protein